MNHTLRSHAKIVETVAGQVMENVLTGDFKKIPFQIEIIRSRLEWLEQELEKERKK